MLLFHCRYWCAVCFSTKLNYRIVTIYCVWHQQFYSRAEVNDSYCIWHCLWWCKLMYIRLCSSREVTDDIAVYDVIVSWIEAMWFSSRSWFGIAVYNVRYNDTSWCFSADIMLFDLNWCALIAYNMLIRVCDGQLPDCFILYVFSLFRTAMFYAW